MGTYCFSLSHFLAYSDAPLQVADEENHFLRSVQIAQGNLIGRRLGDFNSGGYSQVIVLNLLIATTILKEITRKR